MVLLMPLQHPRKDEVVELLRQGLGPAEILQRTGVSQSTIRHWRRELELHERAPAQPAPPVTKDDVKDMQIASLEARLKIAEGTARVGPTVVPSYIAPVTSTPEARWKAAEADNAEHIRKSLLSSEFSVELPDDPCAITFVSDQHISLGNTVDLIRMREDAELIASQEGCFAILGGDATDNHIKHRAAVLAARSQPSDQFELFEYYLSIFAHRVLVAISGNHDLWTNQIAGVDVLSMLLAKQRVCYAPDEAFLKLRVGEQPYTVAMRHQFRMNSSFNETHAVKQWFRLGEVQWDIGCIGHNHVSAIEPFWAHGLERWASRPGSYQITSAYSRQFGYSKTKPMCPTFVLSPNERQIVGFHDLRPALTYLKAVRAA